MRTETARGKRITDVTGDRREVKGKSYHRLSNLTEVIQVLGGRAEILSQIGASSWPHACSLLFCSKPVVTIKLQHVETVSAHRFDIPHCVQQL